MAQSTQCPVVYICRTESFSAAHRLFNPNFTDKENVHLYGKCSNVNGHGHNYRVKVTLRGPVDRVTGLLFNQTQLKAYMEQAFIDLLDHKNLNVDIPEFEESVTSSENLAVFMWKRLENIVPSGMLYEIQLDETDKNSIVYRGDAN